MNRPTAFLALLLSAAIPMFAQSAGTAPQSKPAPAPSAALDNEELKKLVDRDQAVRTSTSIKAAGAGEETDADRRVLVRRMVDHGELHTGLDYRNAALVFQHGDKPDDYLLAHSLAVIGASKGDSVALWLSAATLDRYLHSMNQPQIYGTQFHWTTPGAPWTLQPYNSSLLTDALRKETRVPSLTDQQKQERGMNEKKQP